MVKMVFFAVGCVLVGMLFRPNKTEYSVLIGLTCSLLLLFFGLDKLGVIFRRIEDLSFYMGDMKEFFPLLLKVFGITYLCDFASNLCKDAGYQSVSSQIEILGKISIMLAGMPVVFAVIDQLRQLV